MSFSEVVNLFGLLVPTVFSPALMASNSIFYGVNEVAKGNLIQQEFSDAQRATMGSLNSWSADLTFALLSFLLGALADAIGVIPALVIAALLSLIPMLLYWRVLRPRSTDQPDAPETA